MSSEFDKAAQPSAEQAQRIFSGPLGPMLGQLGVLSEEQQDASGLVQAQMIAVRSAIEDGSVSVDDAKSVLGDNRGNIDFDKLSKVSAEERTGLLAELNVTDAHIEDGRATVKNAQATRSSVNEGHEIAVSPIGFIHAPLHAKDIPNFGTIKQAALLAQRAIDNSEALKRIQSNEHNAELGAKRGFKLWGDESKPLEDAIKSAKRLNEREQGLKHGTYDTDIIEIQSQFDNAARLFKDAGQLVAAKAVLDVKHALINQDVITKVLRTDTGQNATRDECGPGEPRL